MCAIKVILKKLIKLVRVWPHIEIDNKLVQEANRVIWQKLFSFFKYIWPDPYNPLLSIGYWKETNLRHYKIFYICLLKSGFSGLRLPLSGLRLLESVVYRISIMI